MFAKFLICGTVLIGLVAGQAGAQYHHASTAYEGALRGQADYVRACGQANYWSSLANWQNAEATRQWQRTERERLVLRWESKADNRAWLESMITRLTTEEYNDIARRLAPQPLTSTQLDRVTGRLQWPKVLRDDRYARFTSRLDVLVAIRVAGADTDTAEVDEEIDQLTHELLDAVKFDVHRYRSCTDFTAAKKFAEGLIREFGLTNI